MVFVEAEKYVYRKVGIIEQMLLYDNIETSAVGVLSIRDKGKKDIVSLPSS